MDVKISTVGDAIRRVAQGFVLSGKVNGKDLIDSRLAQGQGDIQVH